MRFNMKQAFFVGDLCFVIGYGDTVWQVDGYTFEKSYIFGDLEEEIIYNISSILTGEASIAYQDDVRLICRAKDALDYIRELNKKGVTFMNKKSPMASHEYPNTLDGLLDELSDLLSVEELVGEDDEVKEKIRQVKEKLKQHSNKK